MSAPMGTREACEKCGALNSGGRLTCYKCDARLPSMMATLNTAANRAASTPPAQPAAPVNNTPRPQNATTRNPSGLSAAEAGATLDARRQALQNQEIRPPFRIGVGGMIGSLSGVGLAILAAKLLLINPARRHNNQTKPVDEFVTSISDERGALQRVAQDLNEYPKAPSIKVRWMVKPAGGSVSYPELIYDRDAQTLRFNGDGTGSAFYYQVEEKDVAMVAQNSGALNDLQQQGATQTPPAGLDNRPKNSTNDASDAPSGSN